MARAERTESVSLGGRANARPPVLERLSARRTLVAELRHPVPPDATALKAIRARLGLLRVVAHAGVPFHKVPIVLGIEHGTLKIRAGECGDGFE